MSKYLPWNIVNIFSGMNVSKPFQLLAHKYAGQEIALDNCACNEAHRAQVT